MRRIHEERRPKNSGVHSDQLKRQATRGNRRRDKQALRAGKWES